MLKPIINFCTSRRYWQGLMLLLAAVFLVLTNLVNILLMTMQTGQLPAEIFKWLQLLALLYLLSRLARPRTKKYFGSLLSLLLFLYYLLIIYVMQTSIELDFSFLRRNWSDMGAVIAPFLVLLTWLFPVATLNSTALVFFSPQTIWLRRGLLTVAGAILLPPLFFPTLPRNELLVFAQTIYQRDQVVDHYQNFQAKQVAQSASRKKQILAQAAARRQDARPAHLDNIIVLQIESLNQRLVSTSTTPNFLDFAAQGVYFPAFYANSVQTIFGQENILCALPTSFDLSLVQSGQDKYVTCLPAVLGALGYKSFFLKSYDLSFTRTGEFMQNIGFDEVHADDLMMPSDPVYQWGYREDVFYQRAFDYLERHKEAERNFFYLEVGPTNHWPFAVPADFEGALPYPEPKDHQERLTNTTFIQDSYLPGALERIEQLFPDKNYTVLLLSDHTWPTGAQGSVFNQVGGFEDNFLSAMALRFGGSDELGKRTIQTRYSAMDIMPSLLDLFGVKVPANTYTRSFATELKGEAVERNQTLLIQPYADKYLSVVEDLRKTTYQASQSSFTVYDLLTDPEESEGEILSVGQKNSLPIAENLLPLLNNDQVVMHALGGIDGHEYTNSREALIFHYQRGRRYFEVDLTLSVDAVLVASHNDKQAAERQSAAEFKRQKLANKYTPLDFNDILLIMEKYPDLKLVIDMKSDFAASYRALVDATRARDAALLDRLIPQIYHEHEWPVLAALYEFPAVIYTLHRAVTSPAQIVRFSQAHPAIKQITLSKAWFSRDLTARLHAVDRQVFVHTVNTDQQINYYLQNGVDGIYSDYY